MGDVTAGSPAAKDASEEARAEAARLMGSARSARKTAAVRENGKLGGRPKGSTQTPEAKERMAAARKALWADPEYREKVLAARRSKAGGAS